MSGKSKRPIRAVVRGKEGEGERGGRETERERERERSLQVGVVEKPSCCLVQVK